MLKKFLPFTLAFALCGFVLTGCEEDPVSGDEPFMSAEVDGEDFETSSVTSVSAGGTIVITGAASDGTSITLSIPSSATIESHDISATAGYAAAYQPNPQTGFPAMNGEITISAIDDNEISGTFEFEATDGSTTADIDDGSFYVKRN